MQKSQWKWNAGDRRTQFGGLIAFSAWWEKSDGARNGQVCHYVVWIWSTARQTAESSHFMMCSVPLYATYCTCRRTQAYLCVSKSKCTRICRPVLVAVKLHLRPLWCVEDVVLHAPVNCWWDRTRGQRVPKAGHMEDYIHPDHYLDFISE